MRTLLVHGASVGELLAAETVVRGLRTADDGWRVVYSFTSPSVSQWPRWPADEVRRLPPPLPGLMGRWLNRLDPELILLSRGDLWPAMIHAAHRRAMPVAVIGGRIRPESRRLKPPFRALLTRAARRLSWVGAATDEDAARWRALGVPVDRVTVTADPGVDRLLAREPDPAVVAELRAWAADHPVLVCGSVEPSDRPALQALLAEAPRALVVPHDPDRMSDLTATDRLRVIRRRGTLADCYAVARAGFVGGGYAGGVHNLDEPAAAGVPAMAGPTPVHQLVAQWRAWRDDAAAGRRDGHAARTALVRRAGATARTVPALLALIR